jgi:NAD(P)-dependent dehydrogenase (short-subunit alcohol dehydrogenase family)
VRGALSRAGEGEPRRVVLHHREQETIHAFVSDPRLGDLARRGVATPDHIIRTKNTPVLLPPFDGDEAAYAQACRAAVTVYVDDYRRYFEAGALMSQTEKTMLDPAPRIALVPGVGVLAAGKTEQEARIAADIYEHTVSIIEAAEGYGVYTPLGEDELFDMEYWSLEQAKLGKGAEPPLARQVALITGAGSGIGAAVARLFAAQGAQLVLLDRAAAGLESVAGAVRSGAVGVLPLVVDVTDRAAVAEAMDQAVRRFGGLDLVVSNAGAVWQAPMADCSDDDLRASFELNFFAHQTVAREAVRVFQRQGTGGQLLFNASKAAFNPGPLMGPYALPKAAVVALMRQYALDYGELGVRSNAVNADRVPTALFGDGVLASRAKARGLSVEDYLSGNLLHRPVLPQDVAQAFLALALSAKTTGAVLPVDGGNIAAAPR